jgi:hypothetical protein
VAAVQVVVAMGLKAAVGVVMGWEAVVMAAVLAQAAE